MKRKRRRIKVEQGHIDGAACGDPRYCVVGRAIRSRLKPGMVAEVRIARHANGIGIVDFYKVGGGQWHPIGSSRLPAEANKLACDFDDKKPVSPMAFPLEIPIECLGT